MISSSSGTDCQMWKSLLRSALSLHNWKMEACQGEGIWLNHTVRVLENQTSGRVIHACNPRTLAAVEDCKSGQLVIY